LVKPRPNAIVLGNIEGIVKVNETTAREIPVGGERAQEKKETQEAIQVSTAQVISPQ